jgi:nicotinamide-nucleotide amidase
MIEPAVILSTGDELTTGKVVDTNSAFLADRLFSVGVKVAAVLKVGDDPDRLLWALGRACDLGALIIGTGGLGPTADDLTTEIAAQFLGRKLVLNKPVATSLKKRFETHGIPWTDNNLKQALFPAGATIVPNPLGTAPGFRVALGQGKALFWLSGVPQEMMAMFNDTVMSWVVEHHVASGAILTATFKIHGLTESKLDDLVRPIDLGSNARLSFRAHYPDLTLRLTVTDGHARQQTFTLLCERIRTILGSHVYTEGDLTLEEVVGQLLIQKGQTLALAESCTGGLISHRVTRIPGSSAYYYGGAVTYSNEAKTRFLGVQPTTLAVNGAVSRETAMEMSQGIRERTGASIGLSVTGIAGPSGGSKEKPVGTVWISIAQKNYHEARSFHFHGERERIILGASQAALNWLRLTLIG